MNNVLVVSNYNAGRKNAVMHKKALTKFLLHNSDKFRFITIDEFEQANIEEFDTIISIGGDGTVNKAVSKIYGTDKTLAIMPSGTANLLAAALGMSYNIKKNLKILAQNNTKEIDVISINDNLSILRAGFGYDSDIICKTPQSLKNKFGYFAYFIAGIVFALRLKSKQYEINYSNNTELTDSTCIIIANAANMFRNIISVGNNSKLDDGLFDVFILKAKNPISFFLEFLKIVLGIKVNNRFAKYFQTDNLKIKNTWSACHIDGEKSIMKGDITVNLLPKKIKVYCK